VRAVTLRATRACPLIVSLRLAGDRPRRLPEHQYQVCLNREGAHMTFQEIIKLHPQPTSLDRDALLGCIEECLDCAASCTACADASQSEKDVHELVRVIRLCLDCADACDATGRVVTRQSATDLRLLAAMLEACSAACLASAEECELHAAHHEHCRVCAEVCRRCKKACDDLLATIVVETSSD
jgi:hypothetical protein